jgi:hypothetical protein
MQRSHIHNMKMMYTIVQPKETELNYLIYLAEKHKTLKNEADAHLSLEDEKHSLKEYKI